jgi:hypothetical protein
MIRYEVRWFTKRPRSKEFEAEAEARAFASTVLPVTDQVTIITWAVDRNLPGCKPDLVYRSCSMSILKSDGKWYGAAIHGPSYAEFPE